MTLNADGTFEIGDIESELTRLWRGAGHPGGPPAESEVKTSPAVIRACTLNLVVAGCAVEQADVAAVLNQITARHPCRAIVVLPDGSEGESPRAWVSMVCHASGRGQPQVCSEQLVLTAPPGFLHEVVASVAGLLVAGLPAFLWWRGRPPEPGPGEERFHHLAGVADRILLDSLQYSRAEFRRAAELARRYRRIPFGDLNWARLTRWRAAVAQHFDPLPAQALLPRTTLARIFYAAGPGEPPAAARLMAGWLRARLGASLTIEFGPGQADLLELRGPEACFRIARPGEISEADALSEELRLLGRDDIYEQALAAAVAPDPNA